MIVPQLKCLERALGDERGVPIHRFVLIKEGRAYATDGRLIASVPVPQQVVDPIICVRGDLLLRAAELEGAVVSGITENTLSIRYRPRGRTSLKLNDPTSFPLFDSPDAEWHTLAPQFRGIVEALVPFRGDGAVSTWNSSVHFTPAFAFAANSAELARYDYNGFESFMPFINFSLAPWLVTFMLAQSRSPDRIGINGNLTSLRWESYGQIELEVHARNTEDGPPTGVLDMARAIDRAAPTMPEGFASIIKRFAGLGARHFRVGTSFVEGELGEQNDAQGNVREEIEPRETWAGLYDVERVMRALKHATHFEFPVSRRAEWHGETMRGLLMGLTG